MANSALITGVTGQHDACRSRFLVDKGYQVFGIVARRGTE
jgi:GDPmannose 4,6-dehydratase